MDGTVWSALAVAAIVVVLLWLMFRRGSIADRAAEGTEAMDAEAEGAGATRPVRRRPEASDP